MLNYVYFLTYFKGDLKYEYMSYAYVCMYVGTYSEIYKGYLIFIFISDFGISQKTFYN